MRDTRRNQTRRRAFSSLLAGLCLLSSCGGNGPDGSAGDGPGGPHRLTIARPMDVRSLNPLRQANNATSEVTYQIHESLVSLSPEQELVGLLATS